MIGLVIVSHSAALADGVVELARGMGGPEVAIKAAGGLDMPDRPLGTDAQLVFNAIQEVYSPDGVLVLMDLGSALMSAEIALELLEPEQREHVALCEAPLVEGAVAAAVQARIGSSLSQVMAEARNALTAKAEHIGNASPLPEPNESTPTADAADLESATLVVRNRLGLHARPAARFVQEAGRFRANVSVQNLSTGTGPVNAKSINNVITLGVQQNHKIQITASGPQAQAALAALCALAANNFGDALEEELAAPVKTPEPVPTRNEAGALQGIAASPGIAVGAARRPAQGRAALQVPTHTATDPAAEWQAFLSALNNTRSDIETARAAVAQRGNASAAAIFEAHLLFLDDEALREPVQRAIFDQRINAAAAWQKAVATVAAQYRSLDNDYLRGRATDIEEVGAQVLAKLIPHAAETESQLINEPGILVTDELTAADTARLDPRLVLGLVTALGSSTSHSSILARSLGIPAIAGLGTALESITDGTTLIVDGGNGQLWVNPEAAVRATYEGRAKAALAQQQQAQAASAEPAVTRDGHRVEVAANIGSLADAQAAVAVGAEGVGLLRTEFLFLERQTAPDEEEQYAAYRAIAQTLAGRPLIIRTLDIGGDKPVAYLSQGTEANPFLGWRALRISLAQPEFFKTQLRAIVRAAAEFPVRVMFPMVAVLPEWEAARHWLDEARDEVRQAGHRVPDSLSAGIMIEIPAAAVQANQFARQVDFFSIGTNDLTQYTLAAERGNARVAALADAFQPAVLQLIRETAEAAHTQGKWVGVCGELAGEPAAVPLLVGLGIDELSMSAPAIPRAKQIIRSLELKSVQERALAALQLESAAQVREAFVPPAL